MAGKWGKLGLAIFMCIFAGCRTPKPNLKPPVQNEVMVSPPQEGRYSDPNNTYPKQAWKEKDDPYLRYNLAVQQAGGMGGGGTMTPQGRNGMAGGGGGMGGGPGGGYR